MNAEEVRTDAYKALFKKFFITLREVDKNHQQPPARRMRNISGSVYTHPLVA